MPNALLNLSQTRLLLITGAPASGKTRLASALVGRLGANHCTKDEIKETLLDLLGTADAAWSRRLSDASFALMFQFAPRLMLPGKLLLLEGNFRPGEHEGPLRGVIDRTGASLLQIRCIAAAATRAARLASRALDHTRHPGHQDYRLEAQEASTDGGMNAFLELPGPRLIFDSDAPWEGEFAALLVGLGEWYAP